MTESLLERTLALLRASDLPRRDIARDADVGYEWLKKLENDDIPNPGVVSVQKLHDYLVGLPTGGHQSAPLNAARS